MLSVTLLTVTAYGGGYTPADVAAPDRITVKQAYADVEEGIASFERKLKQDGLFLGMIPCKISVAFNISAKADKDNKATLSLDASAFKIPIKGEASTDGSSEGLRGNQVTVEYDGIACLPKDTLGSTKPSNISTVAQQLDVARQIANSAAGGGAVSATLSDTRSLDTGPLISKSINPAAADRFRRSFEQHGVTSAPSDDRR